MANYKPQVLYRMADALIVKSWLLLPSYGAGFSGLYLAYHWTLQWLLGILSQFSHKQLPTDDPIYFGIAGWWFLFGAAVGLSAGLKLRIEAQKVLCMVEQEKHLNAIARKLWDQPQTPPL